MKLFRKLSAGNKIALISLLLAILTFSSTLIKDKDIKNKPAKALETHGNNSPVVTDSGGDVTIKFNGK